MILRSILVAAFAVTVLGGAGAPAMAQPAADSTCNMTVYPPYGTYVRTPKLHGPGLVLAGGGFEEAPASVFPWMHRVIAGTESERAGNIVVLRASSANEYDSFFYNDGRFASVQTVLIPAVRPRTTISLAPRHRRRGSAVLLPAHQANYVV